MPCEAHCILPHLVTAEICSTFFGASYFLLDGMWTRLLRRVVLWVACTETNIATIGKIFLLGSRWKVDKTTCWGLGKPGPKTEFLNTWLSSKSMKTADRTWTNADKRTYLKGRLDNPAPRAHLLLEGCHWNQSRNKEQEKLSRFVEVTGAVGEQGTSCAGQNHFKGCWGKSSPESELWILDSFWNPSNHRFWKKSACSFSGNWRVLWVSLGGQDTDQHSYWKTSWFL